MITPMTTDKLKGGLWRVADSDKATGTERMVALVALAELDNVTVPASLSYWLDTVAKSGRSR